MRQLIFTKTTAFNISAEIGGVAELKMSGENICRRLIVHFDLKDIIQHLTFRCNQQTLQGIAVCWQGIAVLREGV
jgi:hypothetical protein